MKCSTWKYLFPKPFDGDYRLGDCTLESMFQEVKKSRPLYGGCTQDVVLCCTQGGTEDVLSRIQEYSSLCPQGEGEGHPSWEELLYQSSLFWWADRSNSKLII